MPLTKLQSDILRLLAAHRDPESYVAGSTPLNIHAPRFSAGVTIFQATPQSWNGWSTADFRFFPTIRDETFGYTLHPVDLATNKVAATYGRREPRDVVDLVTIHEQILPMGAVVWAAVGKTLGFTPEGVINEIRRTARYTEADFRQVASETPIDPAATMARLREILRSGSAA